MSGRAVKFSRQQQNPVLQLADVPTKGQWQFGLAPLDDGTYEILHSPPWTDEWESSGASGYPLARALAILPRMRKMYEDK